MKVIDIIMTGSSYRNGWRTPGYMQAKLEDGSIIFLGGEDIKGFDGAVIAAKGYGYDTAEFVAKLDKWTKTGK
jgi:hypothetical protein